MFIILSVDIFHFDKSGIFIKEILPSNIPLILLTLDVSQLDMSGNDIHEMHLENI